MNARTRRRLHREVAAFFQAGRRWTPRTFRHATQPGHGMGMGAHTLIHNGRKP